jgi:hypothetical protein
MKTVIAVAVLLAAPVNASLFHVDQPVPVSLAHGEYYAATRLWGAGGAMVRFGVGLFDRVTLGMSYSANRLLGSQVPQWARPRPEFLVRVAVLKEEGYVPGLVLGFDTQGLDSCDGESFSVREKGGFLAVGKTLDVSSTYFELGANYWQGFDGFVAVNQLLPGSFELMLEYDPGLNDVRDEPWRGGFLNFGVAWTFAERFRVGAALRDIFGYRDETRLNRVIDLSFSQHF